MDYNHTLEAGPHTYPSRNRHCIHICRFSYDPQLFSFETKSPIKSVQKISLQFDSTSGTL